jgi:thiosulfate reductase cytochrome b subunit
MTTQAQPRNWRLLTIVAVAALSVLALAVVVAIWLRTLPDVDAFVQRYPGETALPEATPIGLPPWLGWQHALNALMMLLIIRSGWLVRTTTRPDSYWTLRSRPRGRPGKRISLMLWFHLSVDVLWIVNGVLYLVLLFASGHWARIVPTSFDVVPNAISAALQYLSLDWPTENGWVNYNSLQQLSYFVIVFVAAPLAIVSGVRMSPLWPTGADRLSRIYPVKLARAIHFPVMLVFLAFIAVHVALVLTTGMLRNLNHMYAGRDEVSWLGFGVFAVSLLVMVGAWFAMRPMFLRPIASLTGTVSRG